MDPWIIYAKSTVNIIYYMEWWPWIFRFYFLVDAVSSAFLDIILMKKISKIKIHVYNYIFNNYLQKYTAKINWMDIGSPWGSFFAWDLRCKCIVAGIWLDSLVEVGGEWYLMILWWIWHGTVNVFRCCWDVVGTWTEDGGAFVWKNRFFLNEI